MRRPRALSSPVKTPRCLAPRRNLPVGGSATSARICMAPGLPWAQKPRNEPGLDPATLAGIRGGWINLVIDQQPWLQGYLPILQICLTKLYGYAGLHIDTGGGFADKGNVEFLAPLVEKEIR